MLRSRFYVDGIYHWDNVSSEKPVIDPFIDEETWQKAQETIDLNKTDSHYILQGVLKCRYCSGNMAGGTRLSNHKS